MEILKINEKHKTISCNYAVTAPHNYLSSIFQVVGSTYSIVTPYYHPLINDDVRQAEGVKREVSGEIHFITTYMYLPMYINNTICKVCVCVCGRVIIHKYILKFYNAVAVEASSSTL